ncbi:MAG: tRNA (adenosine(37)-N6)-threonylcarbamoyltransferase complex transferase subunit TsaD [Lachnospiraceae bacterium]|nr:tRNA (adenosine(37)-N6)-threonylcarbamoyltransferase complex transferase subunit TsaD [Lachnospiraceae bacterium]
MKENEIINPATGNINGGKDTLILAIESSCDETAAAVVKNGREVLSNVIYSQIDIHTMYGGVVPEIASRKHIEKIDPVVASALKEAGVGKEDLKAVAVTAGPGLVGSLLVGVAYAKAYAYAAGLPIIGVHHIEGHIAANYIESKELEPPFLCLVVSGGHTELVVVEDYGKFRLIGTTHDDAAGEAFDKVARAIGLGYPGGPKVDRCARAGGRKDAIAFPRGHVDGNDFDFSFSGLKSAVLNYLNSCAMKQGGPVKDLREKREGDANFNPDALIDPETGVTVSDVAASFQEAVVDVLVTHTVEAAKSLGIKKVAMAGGVAANGALRDRMKNDCGKEGLTLYYPSPLLCTDNAAMIGCAAYYDYLAGKRHGLDLNAVPGLGLGQKL